MRGAELYDRVINWPSPAELTMMFGAAVVLIALAAVLLSIGRLRVFARILGVLGVATIMVALFVVHVSRVGWTCVRSVAEAANAAMVGAALGVTMANVCGVCFSRPVR